MLLPLALTMMMSLLAPGMANASAGVEFTAASHGSAANPVLGGLSAKWWKYVLEHPAADSPLSDTTGAGCQRYQSGPVFFLVGTAGGGKAVRDACVVPYGKALFFPVANAFDVSTPGDHLGTPRRIWRDLQVTNGFQVTSAFASVDGKPLPGLTPSNPLYRGCVGLDRGCYPLTFSLDLPAGNLLGLDAATYRPAVADGVYALLAPLSKGPHQIIFNGTGHLGGDFSTDITYNIVVS